MAEDLTLIMNRLFPVARARVFDAWTKPEHLRRWFAPGAMVVVSAAADFRIGGSYRISMSGDNDSGKCIHAAVEGVYREIVPHERLKFSWFWRDSPVPETLVTVEFREVEGGAQILLTHEHLSSSGDFDRHVHGWSGCFHKLERFCREQVNSDAPQPAKGVYTCRLEMNAGRARVFAALTSPEAIQDWWASRVTGHGETGGALRLEFDGLDEHIIMRVDEAAKPALVRWTCLVHTDLPEWSGTKPSFELIETAPDQCQLRFRHEGLTPELQCYAHCEAGWNRFLASLAAYVESGRGFPYRAKRALNSV